MTTFTSKSSKNKYNANFVAKYEVYQKDGQERVRGKMDNSHEKDDKHFHLIERDFDVLLKRDATRTFFLINLGSGFTISFKHVSI